MKFFTFAALVFSVLLVDNAEATTLKKYENHRMTTFSQVGSSAEEKWFWDNIIAKAKKFVGGIVKKVTPMIGGIVKQFSSAAPKQVAQAQTAAKAFVQQLNKDSNGKALAQLPTFNSAEMKSHGFDMKSFAQMDENKLTDKDLKQIILLGLAKDDLSKTL